MATKQDLIDTYYQQIRKTHPELELHRVLVEQNMARAWNQILHDAFSKDLTYLNFYAKDYQNQAINKDSVTNQYYVTLPVAIVQLPDKSEGVRTVKDDSQNFAAPTDIGVKFVPISEQDMRYMTNIDVGLSESSIIGYVVRYDSIWFDKNMTAALAVVSYACTGGGTSTSLQDTVNSFTALNIATGDTVENVTDGSSATVTTITDADNIITAALSGGSDNTWTSGDTYSFKSKVHLELVVPFDVYTGAETVPVPSGKDEQLYLLTTQFILGTTPQRT